MFQNSGGTSCHWWWPCDTHPSQFSWSFLKTRGQVGSVVAEGLSSQSSFIQTIQDTSFRPLLGPAPLKKLCWYLVRPPSSPSEVRRCVSHQSQRRALSATLCQVTACLFHLQVFVKMQKDGSVLSQVNIHSHQIQREKIFPQNNFTKSWNALSKKDTRSLTSRCNFNRLDIIFASNLHLKRTNPTTLGVPKTPAVFLSRRDCSGSPPKTARPCSSPVSSTRVEYVPTVLGYLAALLTPA